MLSPTLQHFRVTSSRAVLDRAHALLDMTQGISLTHTHSSAAWECHRQNLRRGVNVVQLAPVNTPRRAGRGAGRRDSSSRRSCGGLQGASEDPVHKLFSSKHRGRDSQSHEDGRQATNDEHHSDATLLVFF